MQVWHDGFFAPQDIVGYVVCVFRKDVEYLEWSISARTSMQRPLAPYVYKSSAFSEAVTHG